MKTSGNLMTIGQVVKLSATPATTLRYYEKRGLIDEALRVGGQRRFDLSVLNRLMVIKFCRIAGLSLEDIELVIADNQPQRLRTREIAARQVETIDQQLRELRLARRMMLAAATCICAAVDDCDCGAMAPILTELRGQLAPAAH